MSKNTPVAYSDSLKLKLESSLLPMDRYFSVKEWENLIFNGENRDRFFTPMGLFRTLCAEQLALVKEQFGRRQDRQADSKIDALFESILRIMEGLSQKAQESAIEGKKQFGLYAEQKAALAHQPENKAESQYTP